MPEAGSDPLERKERTLTGHFWVAARGFAMGAADVVPGVSGGTMAFITGIYEELLDALHAVDVTFVRRLATLQWREAFQDFPWKFVLALLVGLFTAIFTLASGLHWAVENRPVLVWAFFFGLIAASVAVVTARVGRWGPANLGAAALAALAAFVIVGLTPSETPHTPLLLFLSGAIAITAMILPGLSGAFILLLLGKYTYVLGAVRNLDFVVIGLVGAGAAVGLLAFARLLRRLLRWNHDLVVAILTGFMAGSLRKVWPWKDYEPLSETFIRETNRLPAALDGEVGVAFLLAVIGGALVLLIDGVARRVAHTPRSRVG